MSGIDYVGYQVACCGHCSGGLGHCPDCPEHGIPKPYTVSTSTEWLWKARCEALNKPDERSAELM